MDDIILCTIDCWRHDSLRHMPETMREVADFDMVDVHCHGSNTAANFTSIFFSDFINNINSENGFDPEETSLMNILSNMGYSTGSFVSSNPYTDLWSNHFDEYANDMGDTGITQKISSLSRFLRFDPQVSAKKTIESSKEWFESNESPRFLWIHLMTPHEPYYPGFKRALRSGLLRSYWSNLEFRVQDNRTDETLSSVSQNHAQILYNECISQLDTVLSEFINTLGDDATVILMGDHGEGFDHGIYHHATLYDEVVRVPGFIHWTLSDLEFDVPIRQFDISPTIVSCLGQKIPESWRGRPYTNEKRITQMVDIPDHIPQRYVGARTQDWKVIIKSNQDMSIKKLAFDINKDPSELKPRDWHSAPEEVRRKAAELKHLIVEEENRIKMDEEVQTRLRELGYK